MKFEHDKSLLLLSIERDKEITIEQEKTKQKELDVRKSELDIRKLELEIKLLEMKRSSL